MKILIRDRKFRLKESLYIILTGIFFDIILFASALIYILHSYQSFEYILNNPPDTDMLPLFTHFFDIYVILCLFLYLFKGYKYPIKKVVSLIFSSMLLIAIIDHTLPIALQLFSLQDSFLSAPIFFILRYALSISITILCVNLTNRLRTTINQSSAIQTALLYITTLLFIAFQASVIFGHHMIEYGYTASVILINSIFFVVFTVVAFISFVMFAKSLETKYEMHARELERQNLEHYTNELERNQTDVRKFKHDYQNILLSIDAYLYEDDLIGLKQYYTTSIAPASQAITNSDIALEGLSRVKVREIKSILVAKLMMAQNLGIYATFEADGIIEQLSVDPVSLVRMLGIILDNAIEELTEIDEGRLLVGCFKFESTTTFIVQNTCRSDMPKLHQLMQAGFSTKGTGRGTGLTNLTELANLQPNITLETSVKNNNFVQKLLINAQH